MAIFSNIEIEDVQYQVKDNKTRGLTAKLTVDPAVDPVYVTALHLSHRSGSELATQMSSRQ